PRQHYRATEQRSRRNGRNHPATLPAVDTKIRISRDDHRVGKRFRHAHETNIGKARRQVCVLLHEFQNGVEVRSEVESNGHGAATQQGSERRCATASEEMECLGQDGFAGIPGRRETLALRNGPGVMRIPPAQQCDQEASVNENASGHNQ
ncbi:MAG: hypothetical protein ACREQZ_04475, partial [Woeseiaceae bacterium]